MSQSWIEIEELSLNHWQPLSTMLYDGWLLRFAEGYTKRANSINPIFDSTCDLDEKIEYCERIYASHHLPAIFKITPFVKPRCLDPLLADKGYAQLDITSVRTADLAWIPSPRMTSVTIEDQVSGEWIDRFCNMNKVDDRHQAVMHRMLSNIVAKKGFITLYAEDRAVACGLGIIERGYIGLYDIVTDECYRNQGYGEQLILNLLRWGWNNGARHSYLAVVANNAPASRLYDKLGYKEIYQYWYRVLGGSR